MLNKNESIENVRQENLDEFPKEFGSEYLDSGFAHDVMRIHDIQIDFISKTITAKLDLTETHQNQYTNQESNEFHLSAVTGYRYIAQLIILYICRDLNIKKQDLGEVYEISHEMQTKSKISTPENISATVNFSKYIKRESKLVAEVDFNIEEAFSGKFRLLTFLDK
ncbi:MAG: hypothetical protein ABIF17_02175 [Patescibacteria group bacterium]